MANCWNFFFSSFIHQKWCHRRVMCILLKKIIKVPINNTSERSTRFKICIASVLAPFFSFTACWWLLSKHKCHVIHFESCFAMQKNATCWFLEQRNTVNVQRKVSVDDFCNFSFLLKVKIDGVKKKLYFPLKNCAQICWTEKKGRILIYIVVHR